MEFHTTEILSYLKILKQTYSLFFVIWFQLSEEIIQLGNLSPNNESCSNSDGCSIEDDLLHVAFDLLDGSNEFNQLVC